MVVFETYESLDATSIVSGLDIIYHYTPESNVDSILRNGLRPSSKNMFFNYPDRVYLSIVENETIPKRLKQVSKTEDDYIKLKIHVKRIPSNVKFYYDCMKENSVYTTEMIPDYCISL